MVTQKLRDERKISPCTDQNT